nr:beta-N-acetylhexosaminidase [uncultured Bacteroides sp.]
MLRDFIMTAFFLSGAIVQAQDLSKSVSIIPQPVEIISSSGVFDLRTNTSISFSSKEVLPSAVYLSDYLGRYLSYPLAVKREKVTPKQTIRLINQKNGQISGGYRLEVTPDGITVNGNDDAGVFYGVQTLIQLLPIRAGIMPVVPALTVRDYPRFAYRGMHLDVVRHFFPVSFIKQYIDYLALHKMNYFHWHLTDDQGWRIQMKCRPELTEVGSYREGEIEGLYPGVYTPLPYGGYYTHEQVKEIVAYAAERYITVIPEIDIPGHCMAVLATYPQFSTTPDEAKKCALTWGIFNKENNVLAPTPEVFGFLKDVFSELCDLFPAPYIHVGGDECAKRWWQESDQTQRFMKEQGLKDEKALQSYFIHYVQQVVNAKGKTLIGWDEILEGGISPDCIVMNWRTTPNAVKAIKTGHRVIMTPSAYTYLNIKESRSQSELAFPGLLPLEKVYKFDVIPDSLTVAEASQVWGGQGCLWTEYVSTPWNAEYCLFPRLSALAENLWSAPECKNWERFVQKMEQQYQRYDLWGARYSEAFFRVQDILRKR